MSTFNELKIKSNVRDYSVNFVNDFSEELKKESKDKPYTIIDQNICRLYKQKLEGILVKDRYITVEATEHHKTLDYVKVVIRSLIDNNIKRSDKLIAIGGGIIQDITGFIASILFRGIDWVFYPSTLLAQSDSCIGSKTSINVDDYKNQVGTFYPPSSIILDVNFLKTLSLADMKSGLGEIIKVHLLDGEESLRYINERYEQAFSESEVMKDLIFRSLMIKKGIIEKDEFDRDYRNILNYGHTFGHAIESITNYKVCHGEAVTIGMDMANYVSFKKGLLSEGVYQAMRVPLLKNYPSYYLKTEQNKLFFDALRRDKKNIDRDLIAILTRGPGKMEKMKIPLDDSLKRIIEDFEEMSK